MARPGYDASPFAETSSFPRVGGGDRVQEAVQGPASFAEGIAVWGAKGLEVPREASAHGLACAPASHAVQASARSAQRQQSKAEFVESVMSVIREPATPLEGLATCTQGTGNLVSR